MAHPLRFQLKRTKGFKMPKDGVSVARPSKWGNPFKVGPDMTAEQAVAAYLRWVETKFSGSARVQLLFALRGRPLGCFCKLTDVCHADVLCELANLEAVAAGDG